MAFAGVSPEIGRWPTVNGMPVRFTLHALERLAERFPRRINPEAVTALNRGERMAMTREAADVFLEGEERRQVLNDTKFMTYLYETYGFDKRFVFWVSGDAVFVCVEDHEHMVVNAVTVCDLGSGRGSYNHRTMGARHKFGRREAA